MASSGPGGTDSARRFKGLGLRRDIGFVGLIWASEGSIIGSGWLFGARNALDVAGPAAIISWLIGGAAVMLLALAHAELGAMWPVAGGTARFPHYAFGGTAGASFGWFSWLQAATVAPIEVLAAMTYAQHYSFAHSWVTASGTNAGELTGVGIVIAVILMAILVTINLLGVRMLSNTNSVATWWKVGVPLLVIFILGFTEFHASNFTALNGFMPYGAKGVLSAVSTSGIVFAYLGFEQADQLAGESKDPQRNIPRAIIGSVVIGVIIYVLLQVVFLGALRGSELHGAWATVGANLTGPFAQVAGLLSLGWLATILYIDAVISPAGTGLIYAAGTSRVSYGLSRNGYVPSIYERLDKRDVPWFGLITAFVIGCIAFIPFPSWTSLVGLITGASVLMYAGAPLSLAVFRQKMPDEFRPYRLPAASSLAPLTFVVANLLILWSGWTTVWKLGIAILLGYVLLIANRAFKLNPVIPELNLKASGWILVYLVGIGVITYVSAFGPLTQPLFGGAAVWWDIVLVAVFSLLIFYWAMRSALPTEKIKEMISAIVVPEEEPTAASGGPVRPDFQPPRSDPAVS
jgi:amino acid transporter